MDVIDQHEKNRLRKSIMMKEVEKFMGPKGSGLNGFPRNCLDMKSRDDFKPLFD